MSREQDDADPYRQERDRSSHTRRMPTGRDSASSGRRLGTKNEAPQSHPVPA